MFRISLWILKNSFLIKYDALLGVIAIKYVSTTPRAKNQGVFIYVRTHVSAKAYFKRITL